MTTESNLSPTPRKIDWGTIAPITATVLTALTLWLTFTANLEHRFEVQQQQMQQVQQQQIQQQDRMDRGLADLRQLIQASESGRQADARAINARVDAAEQPILASTPLPYRCPPLG